jgi:KAP family P-loop domain
MDVTAFSSMHGNMKKSPSIYPVPLILSILLQIYKENKNKIDSSTELNSNLRQNFRERFQQVVSGLSLKLTFGVPGIANVDLGYDFSKPVDKKLLGIINFRGRLQQYSAEQTKLRERIDLIVKLVESSIINGYGKYGQLKLVVFIDDLDRCTPEKAAEILKSLKCFSIYMELYL